LLEPVGFRIQTVIGIGTPTLVWADEILRVIRTRAGDGLALPLLPVIIPFVWFARFNPIAPFSLYALAEKPGKEAGGLGRPIS
jgi:hypothetical protein